MPILQGIVTGTLSYELKKEFFGNSLMFREVENYNYEINSIDFQALSPSQIQTQIKNQFSNVYSGDIQVKVFNTANTYQFPSDSIRSSRLSVSVEVKKPILQASLESQFPELTGGNYVGLDGGFLTTYGKYLLEFKEDFSFATNQNGNREFSHNISFGLQTGWGGDNSTLGRKSYSQQIASSIFNSDKNIKENGSGNFGIATMFGEITGLADPTKYRNYYTETYDLLKNTYSFNRKREQNPYNGSNNVFNLNHTITLSNDGTIDVTEKADAMGKYDFILAKAELETLSGQSYTRCNNIYNQFYNFNNNSNGARVILNDAQYSGNLPATLLSLINAPMKVTKIYDVNSLIASYEVAYTNNPTFSGDGTVTSQSIEVNIDQFNKTEITHSFDYTVNKILNNSGYFVTLFNNTTGSSPSSISSYYSANYPKINSVYPSMNLVKVSFDWPNIKTKATAKLYYSNNPTYLVTTNGVQFKILDYNVDRKLPPDIINEYKVINRPNNKSILNYGYQSERGEVIITIKASIGKKSSQFYTDGVGDFSLLNGGVKFTDYLQALYKFGGQLFLGQFNYTTIAFNWFISDSKFSLNSDGEIEVTLNYSYTLKKRN